MYENLELGMTGDDVKILQEKLKRLGFYKAVITGSFGLSTEVGVRSFQRSVGLEETGIVDQPTWSALNDLTENHIATISVFPRLSFSATGPSVRDLQTKLKALLYYTGDINSNFDLETENAVKRFQLNNDLTATGVVDDNTWNVINTLYGNLNDCANESDTPSSSTGNYIVKSGDTLYGIARRFNTTVDELKRLNNLTSNTLSIGQALKVPDNSDSDEENTNNITYKVVAGDTLYSIARRFNTTVDEIKRLNNLTSNTLSIGQILQIPSNEEMPFTNYVVVRGDTLYGIARRFNTTVDAIIRTNNLQSTILEIGQVLRIPIDEPFITYTVRSGDTLYSIARNYNTTVDELKRLNNLNSNILSIGQILKIPN